MQGLRLETSTVSWADIMEASDFESGPSAAISNEQSEQNTWYPVSASSSVENNLQAYSDQSLGASYIDSQQGTNRGETKTKVKGMLDGNCTKDPYFVLVNKPVSQCTSLSRLVLLKSAVQNAKLKSFISNTYWENWWYAVEQEQRIYTRIRGLL